MEGAKRERAAEGESATAKRPPPRPAASPSRRLSTASPCPLDPPLPPHLLGLLAAHPNPAVAQFPHTGFSNLADWPLPPRAESKESEAARGARGRRRVERR